MNRYILASGSPRRKELMKLIISDFEIIVSDKEPQISDLKNVPVKEFPVICAETKAKDVAEGVDDGIIFGFDTVVIVDNLILGKPTSSENAFEMLKMLSGRKHSVVTGVSVILRKNGITQKEIRDYCETIVEFNSMSDDEINEYINTGDAMDKAGAYGIQGYMSKHIKGIEGDYFNVVGLPVSRTYDILKRI